MERDEKRFTPLVDEINQREPEIHRLSDQQLRSKTPYFREKLDAGASLDELLPEAFAVVREAAVRTLKQRHYDVQLMGGVALHQGCIAEMKTGEGKTLTSTLPIYLNALLGKGVHVATVNDYLASRDAEWMGRIYDFLGLSVGLTLGNMSYEEKRMAYKADITYGVNSEFGFDFLRDNKAGSLEEKVQSTGHHYAILDEVDSILIDEARNPLILSDPHGEPVELYRKISGVVKQLKETQHYELDDKASKRGTVALTEEGVEEVEHRLGDALLGGAENCMTTPTWILCITSTKRWSHSISTIVMWTISCRTDRSSSSMSLPGGYNPTGACPMDSIKPLRQKRMQSLLMKVRPWRESHTSTTSGCIKNWQG